MELDKLLSIRERLQQIMIELEKFQLKNNDINNMEYEKITSKYLQELLEKIKINYKNIYYDILSVLLYDSLKALTLYSNMDEIYDVDLAIKNKLISLKTIEEFEDFLLMDKIEDDLDEEFYEEELIDFDEEELIDFDEEELIDFDEEELNEFDEENINSLIKVLPYLLELSMEIIEGNTLTQIAFMKNVSFIEKFSNMSFLKDLYFSEKEYFKPFLRQNNYDLIFEFYQKSVQNNIEENDYVCEEIVETILSFVFEDTEDIIKALIDEYYILNKYLISIGKANKDSIKKVFKIELSSIDKIGKFMTNKKDLSAIISCVFKYELFGILMDDISVPSDVIEEYSDRVLKLSKDSKNGNNK